MEIDKTQASGAFQKATELKKDTVDPKKDKPHFIIKFKQIEKLESQIEVLKERIKNLRPMNDAQDTEKTQLETLLQVYEEQLKELKEQKEKPPFFGLG